MSISKARRRTAPATTAAATRRWTTRRIVLTFLAGLPVLGALVLFADWWISIPDDTVATYVGRQSCIECHAEAVKAWTGSYHDLAMDPATPETVLGDFNNVEFKHFDITSRLYRQDGKYMVYTEGPDGQMHDYEIKYVFGVNPLQNYMVEFDRTPEMKPDEIARLQVLRITWDTKRKRWYYLPPPDVKDKLAPDDDLHWTRIGQCWNHMCADCHSTNLQKNYDPKTGHYRTTFSEIDVSCETCHGPASLHVKLARSKSLFWDRKRGYAIAGLNDDDSHVQIQACAPCHSRRRVVYPGFLPGKSYYDYYDNELLQAATYHADGQILDEVYEYSSFVQSKMYHKGIRCSDCHDPHALRTKHAGNQVCTSCHQHPAGKYDVVAHHRHKDGTKEAMCVECHMPETSYMEVDPRRDHSLRIPRPDLSVQLGTPNACSRCHLDEGKLMSPGLLKGKGDQRVPGVSTNPASASPSMNPAKAATLEEYADWLAAARQGDREVADALARVDQWCANKFREWYGVKDDEKTHFAHTLAAARRGDAAAEKPLTALVRDRRLPAIVRATGVMELGQFNSPGMIEASEELLSDYDPQVREMAIANLQILPDEELVRRVAPLMKDPIRAVRTEAARALARVNPSLLKGSERQWLDAGLEEFKRGLLVTNDRAAAHLTLGILYETLQDIHAALEAYRTAIQVEPRVSGPRTNLAALLDRLADEADQKADTAHSSQYRAEARKLRGEELVLLKRDVGLAPNSAALHYRYGLLLYLFGRLEEAEESLAKACELEPNTPDFAWALALFYQKQQRIDKAFELAKRLVTLRPADPSYRQLLEDLRRS